MNDNLDELAVIRQKQATQSNVIDSSLVGVSGEEQKARREQLKARLEFEKTGVWPEYAKSSGDGEDAGDWTAAGDGSDYPAKKAATAKK